LLRLLRSEIRSVGTDRSAFMLATPERTVHSTTAPDR